MGEVVHYIRINDRGAVEVIVSDTVTERHNASRVPWWQRHSLVIGVVLTVISIGGLLVIAFNPLG